MTREVPSSSEGSARAVLSADKGELSAADAGIVPAPATDLVALARDVQGFVAGKRTEATRVAYGKDLRSFLTWVACPACPVPKPLPKPLSLEEYAAQLRRAGAVGADVVALWVAELVRRGRKLKTIERSVAAITVLHQLADFEPPTRDPLVRDTLEGARRELARLGRAAPQKKKPLTAATAVAIVRELDTTRLAGQRNAALVCFGVASALRREELARLEVGHLRLGEQGVEVFLPWSKTDQVGEGVTIPVAFGEVPNTCPVRTVQRWLVGAGIEHGPVFRRVDRHDRVHGPLSPRAIAEIVKRCAASVGLDAADFSGHSLRSGFATSAARAGKSMSSIMKVTRHTDVRTAAGYVRAATLFDGAANKGIGL